MPAPSAIASPVSGVALRELITLRGGFAFRTAIPEVANGGTWAVQLRDFKQGQGPNWKTVIETRLPRELSEHEWLKSGDILLASRGARFFAALIEDVPLPAVASSQFMVLNVTNADVLDPAFLAWQLNQAPAQAWFDGHAKGAVQRNLTRDVIESVTIALPSLAFQKSVANLAQLAKRERAALEEITRIREAQLNSVAVTLNAALEAKESE
jgi:restriction endonuclease S subunit